MKIWRNRTRCYRRSNPVVVLSLILLFVAGCGAQVGKTSPTTLKMSIGRSAHTATRLGDGRILFAGGFTDGQRSVASAEIFDPADGSIKKVPDMSVPRQSHSASLVPNGNVLIIGGFDGSYLDSAEIFDVRKSKFVPAGRLASARMGHTATTLGDGRILIAGGVGTNWTFLASSEIFDPKTGNFSKVGDMTETRESHTATLLSDGRVLITGGHTGRRAAMRIFRSAEIFDPQTRSFRAIDDLLIARHKHDAVALSDGRVLIIGGSDARDLAGAYTSVEVFNPKTGGFDHFGEMNRARFKLNGTSLRLSDGRILIGGGAREAEILDPATGKFTLLGVDFGSQRHFATATETRNGSVMIAGGYDERLRVASEIWRINL